MDITAIAVAKGQATAEAAQQAAGYAGAATYALGPDENGLFSFFMNEEE